MRILLVEPNSNIGRSYVESPNRALLILGTIAKGGGHDVEILQAVNNTKLPDMAAYDLIGITCNTFQVQSAKEIAARAKEAGVRTALGGPHSIAWDNRNCQVDDLVKGPGEAPWRHILGIEKTDSAEPVIDYSLIDPSRYVGIFPVGMFPSIAIMASRGCPYSCKFCNTPIFWGKKVRRREPCDVVKEVRMLHQDYGVNEVFFQDDTFNLNHHWAYEIFEGIISARLNTEMTFKLACRADENLVTKEFLELAMRAGVWNIFYGVESGSQQMLDAMGKGITLDEIERAFRMTHEAHIQTQASFVLGFPGESRRTLSETRRFLHKIKPNTYGWAPANPFPGTELDKIVTERGWKRDIPYEEYSYGKVICRTEELDYGFFEAFTGF